ncbi:MAG TPA: FAD-dependent oxidoreductase [Ottowia sp.]|uniref:FAD-dependent oxidoreductase n=1 Tax=Ottowia sp. TaxID=1898956 RepID=UPI002BC4805E|nr:FAD-dependent oxidoreductase [Ottowia sp.]HMN22707.1 FAD-dependent oxidoreductase [Ottowia sp.]
MSTGWRRRSLLAAGAALAAAGCTPRELREIEGGFVGASDARGHLLRAPWPTRAPDVTRTVHTVIAGGGIAGLAAARALRLAGHDDFALLELEDAAGGNSRGMELGGMACPMGAHYLPLPGDAAHEVQDLLEELGLRQRVAGRWRYDERSLCHSPQERLFLGGQWQDGLLPQAGVGTATLVQYRRFGAAVRASQRAARYAIPVRRSAFAPAQLAQDALSFDAWLDAQGLDDPRLRWYLDYCCRDDYGAGSASVSAWAGLHYFASRHGFQAPGEEGDGDGESSAVLTWPEGNGWLAARLAAPLGERLHAGRVVGRVAVGRHGVVVDALHGPSGRLERWQARQAVLALPAAVALRVLERPPAALRELAAGLRSAAWLVANLQLRAPLDDRPGAAPSWDNVLYGAPGLGYVDAMHQSLRPVPGPTVLTYYRALGDSAAVRQRLLDTPWTDWRDAILAELGAAHPDLAAKTERIALVRHGHAMAVPRPGMLRQVARLRGAPQDGSGGRAPAPALVFDDAPRLAFAHADWSGCSLFEEAFTLGHAAGRALA